MSGNKLVVRNATTADICVFQCQASNEHGTIMKNIIFNVLAQAPTLYHTPNDVIKVAEGQPIRARCKVVGAPRPTFTWSIPDSIELRDGRINIFTNHEETLLTINETRPMDEGRYQCMASNKFGKDFATFEITVKQKTKILDDWKQSGKFKYQRGMVVFTAKKNNSFSINCSATTDQTEIENLKITWFQKKNRILTSCEAAKSVIDSEIFTCELFISSVGSDSSRLSGVDDGGVYMCEASTELDKAVQFFYLNIQDVPEPPIRVQLLSCTSTQATLSWQPGNDNHDPITKYAVSYSAHLIPGNFMKINTTDSLADSLQSPHSAAKNRVQHESVKKYLLKDDFGSKKSHGIEVDFRREVVGNDRKTTLNFNQSLISKNVTYQTIQVPAYQRVVRLKLHPNFYYTFDMKAYNSLGWSQSSSLVEGHETCITEPTAPSRNPDEVCATTGEANELIVTWKPLFFHELNGPNFRYLIKYKKLAKQALHGVDMSETFAVARNWNQNTSTLKIRTASAGEEPFLQGHVISVLSENDVGVAPIDEEIRKLCFTGQKEPLDAPQNFQINLSSVTNTSAQFEWDHVNTSINRIRGFFLGYQIHFWKTQEPEVSRNITLVLNHWEQCPQYNSSKLDYYLALQSVTTFPPIFEKNTSLSSFEPRKEFKLSESGGLPAIIWTFNDLWPFTNVSAFVMVLNGQFSGPKSDVIEFVTKEGVPEPVLSFGVKEVGSKHVWIYWEEPVSCNGVLIGYEVAYKLAPPIISSLVEFQVLPTEREFILGDILPSSDYLVYIWAGTRSGRSKENILEVKTNPLTEPDEPSITSIEVGGTWILVAWNSSIYAPPNNPGSAFQLEFRNVNKGDSDSERWDSVEAVDGRTTSLNVTNITIGNDYQFRVIAITDDIRRKVSKVVLMKGDRATETLPLNESSNWSPDALVGWTFGLLVLFCFAAGVSYLLYRRKVKGRSRYHVYAKEAMKGNTSINKTTMDRNFREFKKFSLRLLRNRSEMKNGRFYLKESDNVKVTTEADNQSYAATPQLHQHFSNARDELGKQYPCDGPPSVVWEDDDDEVAKMLLQRNSLSLLLDNDTHLNFNEDGSFIGVYIGKRNSAAMEDGDGDSGIGGGGELGGVNRAASVRNGVIIDGNIYNNGVRLTRGTALGKYDHQNVFEKVDDLNNASYNVQSSTAILGHKNGRNYKEQYGQLPWNGGGLGGDLMPSRRRRRKPGEERRRFRVGVDYIREGSSTWMDDANSNPTAVHTLARRPENIYVVQPRLADASAGAEIPARASFGDDLIDSASFLEEIGEVLNMSLS